jgi:hypothetical protein
VPHYTVFSTTLLPCHSQHPQPTALAVPSNSLILVMLFQAKFNGHSLPHISQSSHVLHTPSTAVFYLALPFSDTKQFACTLVLFLKKPDTPTWEIQIEIQIQTLATLTQSLLSINFYKMAKFGVTRLTSVCDAEFRHSLVTVPAVGLQATRRNETLQLTIIPIRGCFAADIWRRRVPRQRDAGN